MSQGWQQAGEVPTLLLQLPWAGVVCPTPCRVRRRMEVGGEGLKESALASEMLSCLEMEDRDACSLWQGKGTWSLLVPAQAQLTLVQCPDS